MHEGLQLPPALLQPSVLSVASQERCEAFPSSRIARSKTPRATPALVSRTLAVVRTLPKRLPLRAPSAVCRVRHNGMHRVHLLPVLAGRHSVPLLATVCNE